MKGSKGLVLKLWQLAVIIFINILIIGIVMSTSANALSKVGSTGAEVREIQTRLKKWGYFNSTVDGIYGTKTKNAARNEKLVKILMKPSCNTSCAASISPV